MCAACAQGRHDVYEQLGSSCLDTVLVHRTGLPIAMAVLHSAVGRRAGLDCGLVNMPGRVINRARVATTGADGGNGNSNSCSSDSTSSSGTGSSGSGSSPASTRETVYFDVFYGRELQRDALR